MKTCNKDCEPMCDFCRMFNHNEKLIDGHYVYVVGHGYCVYHEKPTSPEASCQDFICGGYKVEVP